MTVFDDLNFEQRSYTIQQLVTLTETLKECNLREELHHRGLVFTIGTPTLEDIEQKILEFSLNHFGAPYSHEAKE